MWHMKGGEEVQEGNCLEDGKTFFCQKHYDVETARFEDISSCKSFYSNMYQQSLEELCPSCVQKKVANLVMTMELVCCVYCDVG